MSSLALQQPLPELLRRQLLTEQDQQEFASGLASICERASPHPLPDSEQELELAKDMCVISLSLFKGLGPKAVDILRADINQQIEALLAQEYAATETIRKLAFAQLREAVAVFGKFIERMSAVFAELSYEVIVQLLEEAVGNREVLLAELRSDVSSRYVAVASLSLMLALEFIAGNLEDFTYWSRRAVEASRRVEPVMQELVPNVRGNVSRLRSQFAWAHWDQTEIDRELSAWKDLD